MLPQEFLKRMENMLGEEYPAFLKSYDIARYQALRLNPQKGDDASFLNRGVFSLERVPWAEHGYYYTAQGEKGWYLITVDGYSTGWGKLAGGIMKNHYPKGLRKRLY